MQRHEIVGVARHHRAHVGFTVDFFFQALGDGDGDVFLKGAAAADGARVFAPMAGVDGDGDQARDHGLGARVRSALASGFTSACSGRGSVLI